MFPPWRDVARIGAGHCRAPKVLGTYCAPIPGRAPEADGSNMAKLQAKSGSQPSRIAFAPPSGHVQSASFTTALHPKNSMRATPAGHHRAGRSDRSMRCGGGVGCNLRRRLPGVLVRVRPGRGQHDALDALATGITRTIVSTKRFRSQSSRNLQKMEHAPRCAWASSMVRI